MQNLRDGMMSDLDAHVAAMHDATTLDGQVSYGYLASPEALHPGESVQRITASATNVTLLADRDSLISTLAWGQNRARGAGSNAVLAETALDLGDIGVTFARGEYVEKRGEDFGLPMMDAQLPIWELAIGHVHLPVHMQL